eukprot:TRINITY_DN4146_c0_g3_i1.p1 TRINITY_DN4146_c0_g3~~TRINITY_DN4146_c0_g3_i1.p1  ORF type:complete len:803 (-),score=128.52 TRINITY_DN4146_c0_g3_i1:5-2413(-)
MGRERVQHGRTEWQELAYVNASCVFALVLVAGLVWIILSGQRSGQHGAEMSSLGTSCSAIGSIGIGIIGISLGRLRIFSPQTSSFGLSALSCVFSCVSVVVVEEHERQQLDLLALSLIYKIFPIIFGWSKLHSFVWAGFTVAFSTSVQLITFPTEKLPTSAVYITVDVAVAIAALFVSSFRTRASKAIYASWQIMTGERDVFEKVTRLTCDGVAWVSIDDKQDIVIKRLSQDLNLLLRCHANEQQECMYQFRSYLKDSESYANLVSAMKRLHTAPLRHPTQLRTALGDTHEVELILVPHQITDESAFNTDGYLIAVRRCQQQTSPAGIQSQVDSIAPTQNPVQAAAQVATRTPAMTAAATAHQLAQGPSVIQVEMLGRPATPQNSNSPSAQLATPEEKPESRNIWDDFETSCSRFASEAVLDLTQLIQLGKREHWLISCDEVELLPQKILGTGGFGVVVEAKFYGARLAAKFAKEVNTIDLSSMQMSSNMVHELRMLRHVRHPNIVLFYGACIELERREIVLLFEKIRAPTLSSFVMDEYKERHNDSSTSLNSDRKLVKALIDVCRALHYLHSRSPPLIHGDLKPVNIFVTREEEVEPHAMLADFGLAKQMLATNRTSGFTERWAAPEVLLNESKALSTAADVFSFGRLMTFVITGQPPLPHLSPDDIVSILKSGSHLPPPNWSQEVLAKACSKVAEMCLDFLAAKRPSTLRLHMELECLPKVITGAYAGRSHLSSNSRDPASSQQSNAMGIVPPMPGSIGEEVASYRQAFASDSISGADSQSLIETLQQARAAAAACNELL